MLFLFLFSLIFSFFPPECYILGIDSGIILPASKCFLLEIMKKYTWQIKSSVQRNCDPQNTSFPFPTNSSF